MPIDEFYNSTPRRIARRVPYFIQMRDQAEREKEELVNVTSWLNGLYVMRAIGSTFGKKKYPEEPVNIFDHPDIEGVEEVINPADGFRAWAIVYNDQRRRQRGDADGGEH